MTLPPVPPSARAVVHESPSDPDIFSLPGKRWAEAGTLRFRVVLGEHGGDSAGGVAFAVAQTASQDLSTC